jgi:MFS family permease
MGIFAGRISDNVSSRKNLLALACIVMSATSLLTGTIDSFLVLVVMRFILGLS